MANPPSPAVVDLSDDIDSDLSDLSDVGTPPPPSAKKRSAPDTVRSKKPGDPKKAKQASATPKQPQQKTLAALFGQPEPKFKTPAKGKAKAPSRPRISDDSTSTAKGKTKPSSTPASAKSKKEPQSSAAGADKGFKNSEAKLCHHHRRPCANSPILQCTFLRNGSRCQLKFCHNALDHNYGVDASALLKAGRTGADASQHCPASEAKYFFTCPRCEDRCACSPCRKRKGLLPLAKIAQLSKEGHSIPESPFAAAAKVGKGKAKTKDTTLTAALKRGKKADADGITTPPPNAKPVKNGLALAAKPRALPARVLKPPQPVSAPVLETIDTRLPHENMRTRMWLYESFVRFDKFGLPKSELSHLDKFENWSHARVREMLSTLLRFLGGLQHIDKGQPTKNTTKAVMAFRKYGHDLSRGEPWTAVREMLARFGLEPEQLPYVEHPLSLELENRPASPPLVRETRNRAAKGGRQVDYSRQLGMLADWDDEFGDGEDEAVHRGAHSRQGGRRGARRLASESDDDAMDDNSGSDGEGSTRRGSRRQTHPAAQDEEIQPASRNSPGEVETQDEAPDMETKVALLAAMIDAALMTEEVADELKLAPDEILALERQHRIDLAEMEKDINEKNAELQKRAPSLMAPEFQAWKAERAEFDRDAKWRRMDLKVFHEIQVDAHALRTGPLGYDADGREYWHLREYQDVMPRQTEGRYSWCLIVLGKPFPPPLPDADASEEATTKAETGDEASEPPQQASASGTSVDVCVTTKAEGDAADADRATLSSVAAAGGSNGADTGTSINGTVTASAANSARTVTQPTCMGTNNPITISKLIAFLRYLCEQKQYEENRDMQQREMEQAAKLDSSESESPRPAGMPGPGLRKAKQVLKDQQEARRLQTERLVKKLEKTRDYFAWHREEVIG